MNESLGALLRQRREAQGIALEAIVSQTKIKLSLLEGLERDDVSHWPGGLFRRAFVRAYSQAIGLDPEVVLREFLAAHCDSADVIAPTQTSSLVAAIPALSTPAYEPDVQAIADLCSALGRVECADEFPALLDEAARSLSTKGLIVWLWDDGVAELQPVLAHGYSEKVLARFRAVTLDEENPVAAAFRSSQPCAIAGALVVPLMTPAGCTGALALELLPGLDHDAKRVRSIRATATILAAMFAQLVGGQTLGASRVVRSRESA
jgi:transcriptional regulator with XRE-family HTH domain